MTLTTAECPLQDDISAQTARALDGIVASHTINWVWMPAWGTERITEDGRDMMKAMGFYV
jgi:metal-sulfur cluster biosynthetic enzyme